MESISADILKKCFIAGAKNLEANKEYINELNVFPVPVGACMNICFCCSMVR